MWGRLFLHSVAFTPFVFYINGYSLSDDFVITDVLVSFVMSIFLAGISTYVLFSYREKKVKENASALIARSLREKGIDSVQLTDLDSDWESSTLPKKKKESTWLYSPMDKVTDPDAFILED